MEKGRGHHKLEIVRERDELALVSPLDGVYQKEGNLRENCNSYSKTDTDATFLCI